jgi:hypothetical protein
MAEQYPTLRAGQKATGALLASMLPRTVRKVSDTTRTNNTTTADPELQITVEANAVYTWTGWIKYNASTADDINIDFTAPAGALGEWTAHGAGLTAASGTAGYSIRTESTDVTSARSFGGTATEISLLMVGTLRMGGTAGTFSMDWANSGAGGGTSIVFTDSYLVLTRIA